MIHGGVMNNINEYVKLIIGEDSLSFEFNTSILNQASLFINDAEIPITTHEMHLDFLEYDLIYSQVELEVESTKINISSLFDKYRLETTFLEDTKYMNENLFAAPSRQLIGNDLFYQLISIVDKIEHSNKFLGGVLTLLTYRIADSITSRHKFISLVQEKKKLYDTKVQFSDEIAIRWYVSSSATVSTLLMMTNRVEEAETILKKQAENSYHYSLADNVGWNQTICMINLSLILFSNKDINGALKAASFAYEICKTNISYMGSCQNNFVLFQTLDCKVMIDLMHNSLVLICKYSALVDCPKKYSLIKLSPKHTFNYSSIIKRFTCKAHAECISFYESTSNIINRL